MSTAFRELVRVAPCVDFVLTKSDGGDVRAELVYDHGPGEPAEVLATLPIPRASLADVGALLLRAAEVAS